jgi:hypothetical protein
VGVIEIPTLDSSALELGPLIITSVIGNAS